MVWRLNPVPSVPICIHLVSSPPYKRSPHNSGASHFSVGSLSQVCLIGGLDWWFGLVVWGLNPVPSNPPKVQTTNPSTKPGYRSRPPKYEKEMEVDSS